MERTLVLIKPDGVQRQLVGEILSRFERKGLKIAGMKFIKMSQDLAERHYAVHKGKSFYNDLVSFITSGPVVAMVLEGRMAVKQTRNLMGATRPEESTPGSVRGDLAIFTGQNLVHGSDSDENARAEIANFFNEGELVSYELANKDWIG
ncbi:MAG: nucleoside-diphosphate kinase [Candidatus Wallbacteria bacterium]|nr:nucleoside-diphosphate kinase [Candidatus Wallbacteria bacterium]